MNATNETIGATLGCMQPRRGSGVPSLPRWAWAGLAVIAIAMIPLGLWFGARKQERAEAHAEAVRAQLADAVAASDDFETYGEAFAAAAAELVERERCAAADIERLGGFVRAGGDSDARAELRIGEHLYFVHCGDTTADRWYVAVKFNSSDRSAWRVFQRR